MISDHELRRRLDELKEELHRAAESGRPEPIGRARAIVEELRSTVAPEADDKKHSILEWRGVGKEFWSKIDVDEYIRKERESWD